MTTEIQKHNTHFGSNRPIPGSAVTGIPPLTLELKIDENDV